MICPSCGSPNETGRKFCGECGSRLALACAACGAQNGPTAKFCGECGGPLTAGASAAVSAVPAEQPATEPATERRLVSVLFADLVGFTSLAASRDAEAVRELLTGYFESSRQTIERYGGTVEKFIGDAVMAVWGAPVAREDDAERAVRAGLELVANVRELGRETGLELSLRAGILTGEAAVTVGATNQGLVAGDMVNTASRLQSVAEPGTVLVGEATQQSSSASILFEPVGPQSLKGKEAPVPAWRALRVVAERGGANRAQGLEAPFVGREAEIGLLKDRFHATSRDGRARLVSITGQGGIGKSRLAREFSIYIDGLVESVLWHDGRSPAYGEGMTFWALGEMVRERCRLSEDDDDDQTRERVRATLADYVPDADERRWIEPALLALLDVGEAPSGGRDALFAAWRTFFERLASRAPTVLVFEDIQWADSGLVDFIEHLLEWSAAFPLLIVTLARPELLDRRPDWGAGRRDLLALSLEPLSDDAMHELLTGLVPGLPEDAAATIVGRADGIPLYAVETVRMLLAEGRLEEVDGVYVPTGPLGELAVPQTLQALIAARLDALDAADRALLQDAAVLGQSFSVAALAAVAGREESDVESRLRALGRRELVTLVTDPRSPERGQWSFGQALIREVAYGILARRDRRARHLAAARYFDSLEGAEMAGARAYHFLDAYRAAPDDPDAEEVAGQARVALRAAAERAASLGSHEQALKYLEAALEITSEPAEEAELQLRASVAGNARADLERAESHGRRAIELWRAVGDRPAELRASVSLARILGNFYRLEEAAVVLEAAVDSFGELGVTEDGIALVGQLARVEMLREHHDRAVELADRALSDAEALAARADIADVLITKGAAYSQLGRALEGRALLEAGIRIADEDGLDLTAMRGRMNLIGNSWLEPTACLDVAQTAIDAARRLGDKNLEYGVLGNYTDIATTIGRWDEALAEAAQLPTAAPEQATLSGNVLAIRALRGEKVDRDAYTRTLSDLDVAFAAPMLFLLDLILALAEGRLDDLVALSRRVDAVSPQATAQAHVVAGHVAAWRRDAEGLRRSLDGLDDARARGLELNVVRVVLNAALDGIEGRQARALDGFAEATERCRNLQLRLTQMMLGIDVAATVGVEDAAAAALVDEARGLMTELRAAALLDRLEEALAVGGQRVADDTAGTATMGR